MESSFSGTYFDYKNGHHRLSEEERPYYILLFGQQANLEKVRAKLESEHNFDYEDVLLSYEMEKVTPLERSTLMKMPGTADVTVMTAKSMVQIKGNPMVPVDVKVRLAMQNLPAWFADEDILEDNLMFTYWDESYSVDVDKSEFIQDISVDNQSLCTYDVVLQFNPEFLSSFSGIRKCCLSLPGFLDPWYIEYSTDDDTDIDDESFEETFALQYFIGGIIKGMEIKIPEKVVNVDIILQKQK